MQGDLFSRKNLLCVPRGVSVANLLMVRRLVDRISPATDEHQVASPELARSAAETRLNDRSERCVSPITHNKTSPTHHSCCLAFSPPMFATFSQDDDCYFPQPQNIEFDTVSIPASVPASVPASAPVSVPISGVDSSLVSSDLSEDVDEDDLTRRFTDSLHLGGKPGGKKKGPVQCDENLRNHRGTAKEESRSFKVIPLSLTVTTSASSITSRGRLQTHDQVASWLQTEHMSSRASILIHSDSTRARVLRTVVDHLAQEISLQHKEDGEPGVLMPRCRGGNGRGVLLLTTKAQIEAWSGLFRSFSYIRLLEYTDSLSKRRSLGSQRLRHFDVIITTIDTLKAKETVAPEEELRGRGGGVLEAAGAAAAGEWIAGLGGLKQKDIKMVDISLLHLYHYSHLVVDEGGGGVLKPSSLRGVAIKRASASSKLGLVGDDDCGAEPYALSAVKCMREVLQLEPPVSGITLDARF